MSNEIMVVHWSSDEAILDGIAVSPTDPIVCGWLAEVLFGVDVRQVAAWLSERTNRVAILHRIEVAGEAQGAGAGVRLMEAFRQVTEAEAILLLCDSRRGQREGFDLCAFYRNRNFAEVCSTPNGIVMAFPQSVASELKSAIGGWAWQVYDDEWWLGHAA